MEVEVLIDGEVIKVELERAQNSDFSLKWMGPRAGEARLTQTSPGHVLVTDSAGRTRSIEYGHSQGEPGRGEVRLAGRQVAYALPARERRQGGRGAGGNVKAPMNGQVVKVLKQPGDEVQEGEVVLILEAMKMENEVESPVAGVLKSVGVSPGDTVEPGFELFMVEQQEPA